MKTILLICFITIQFLIGQSQEKLSNVIPIGMINGKTCEKCVVELTKGELEAGVISVSFSNILSELKSTTKEFKIKFPNQPAVHVYGELLNKEAKHLVKKSAIGDDVFIFGIKAIIKNDGSPLKQATPIKVKIVE